MGGKNFYPSYTTLYTTYIYIYIYIMSLKEVAAVAEVTVVVASLALPVRGTAIKEYSW